MMSEMIVSSVHFPPNLHQRAKRCRNNWLLWRLGGSFLNMTSREYLSLDQEFAAQILRRQRRRCGARVNVVAPQNIHHQFGHQILLGGRAVVFHTQNHGVRRRRKGVVRNGAKNVAQLDTRCERVLSVNNMSICGPKRTKTNKHVRHGEQWGPPWRRRPTHQFQRSADQS